MIILHVTNSKLSPYCSLKCLSKSQHAVAELLGVAAEIQLPQRGQRGQRGAMGGVPYKVYAAEEGGWRGEIADPDFLEL